MVRLKYGFRTPIQKDGLKRVNGYQRRILAAKPCFELSKNYLYT